MNIPGDCMRVNRRPAARRSRAWTARSREGESLSTLGFHLLGSSRSMSGPPAAAPPVGSSVTVPRRVALRRRFFSTKPVITSQNLHRRPH